MKFEAKSTPNVLGKSGTEKEKKIKTTTFAADYVSPST